MPDASPPAPTPRRAPPAPGAGAAKRARHARWVRIAWAATAVALIGSLGTVTALGLRQCSRSPRAQEEETCRTFLDGFAALVRKYEAQRGRLPASLADLRAPDLEYPYEDEPNDCWGKPIEYRVVDAQGGAFRLRSCGPDAMPDTEDDIVWPWGTPFR